MRRTWQLRGLVSPAGRSRVLSDRTTAARFPGYAWGRRLAPESANWGRSVAYVVGECTEAFSDPVPLSEPFAVAFSDRVAITERFAVAFSDRIAQRFPTLLIDRLDVELLALRYPRAGEPTTACSPRWVQARACVAASRDAS